MEHNKSKDPISSEQDDPLLKYLTWIFQMLNKHDKPPQKKFWDVFREPTVVATLITVLIGGIAATSITGMIQWKSAERDFNQSILKARNDRQLASYNEYLTQEQALTNRIYALIGVCRSASERLIGLTRSIWRRQPPNDSQMNEIIKDFNSARGKWNTEVVELGLLMTYYHPESLQTETDPSQASQPNVLSSWNLLQGEVSTYLKCAWDWKTAHSLDKPAPTDEEINNACTTEYGKLEARLNQFKATLITSRRNAPQNWELHQQTATVAPSLGSNVKSAFRDGTELATAISLFLIRAVVGLSPLIIISAAAVWIFGRRIRHRGTLDQPEYHKSTSSIDNVQASKDMSG